MSEPSQPNPGIPQDVAQKYDEELVNPPPVTQAQQVSAAELKAGAEERAKQRPLLQKILAVFKKEKSSYRELIINSEPLEKRVALLIDGRLEKFEIERESDDRMVGGIYKGRIKNLDPGLKAAFVDIGYSKNAFLHYWDIVPNQFDSWLRRLAHGLRRWRGRPGMLRSIWSIHHPYFYNATTLQQLVCRQDFEQVWRHTAFPERWHGSPVRRLMGGVEACADRLARCGENIEMAVRLAGPGVT